MKQSVSIIIGYTSWLLSIVRATLFLILFQPFQTTLVRQVLHLEVLKLHVEALTIGTCSHHAHLDRGIVLHPGIAHHGISLVVERVPEG